MTISVIDPPAGAEWLADKLKEVCDDNVVRADDPDPLSVAIASANCVFAVSETSAKNLGAAVDTWCIDSSVAVVLETFDQALAHRLERVGLTLDGVDENGREIGTRHVRRAYFEAALAGPFFLGAALKAKTVYTMRFREEVVPVCQIAVREGSPLAGSSPGRLRRKSGCEPIACRRGGTWRPFAAGESKTSATGDLLVAGRQANVMRACFLNPERPGRGERRFDRRLRALGGHYLRQLEGSPAAFAR